MGDDLPALEQFLQERLNNDDMTQVNQLIENLMRSSSAPDEVAEDDIEPKTGLPNPNQPKPRDGRVSYPSKLDRTGVDALRSGVPTPGSGLGLDARYPKAPVSTVRAEVEFARMFLNARRVVRS